MDTRCPLGMSPNSAAFALLLGALAALPSFGIDMSLPALDAIGASLGVDADKAGLTISVFMVGYAVAPPFCGPISDRIGRKPIMLGAVAFFAVASLGCTVSHSLAELLAWRVMQGMGAGVGTTITLAVIQDLFDGPAGRAKFSDLASLMVFVPMVAPAAGTAVLTFGGWRAIYGLLTIVGFVLLGIVGRFFVESAKLDNAERPSPKAILRSYALVLSYPVCLGYILVNAAAFGALFAYITGSPLFFIDALGLTRGEYSLVYAGTFVGVLASVFANGRLSRWAVAPAYPLVTGIALAGASAAAFLVTVLAGWSWVPGLVGLLVLGTMGFGLIVPNAMHAAMQPLPSHAGAVSAMTGFVQVLTQSIASALVVSFNGRDPGLSMAVAMILCSIGALLAYGGVARPADAGAALAKSST
ncbi:MAG: transporter, family, bicyclomycin/chloramphenicol resistance protein [Rhodospirillales bacterium]|nr:transporter, family, bicyclomycin/chloramphenicol resistance protein [Rhodospirillales bacterium]